MLVAPKKNPPVNLCAFRWQVNEALEFVACNAGKILAVFVASRFLLTSLPMQAGTKDCQL